jgi:hypothetical protein
MFNPVDVLCTSGQLLNAPIPRHARSAFNISASIDDPRRVPYGVDNMMVADRSATDGLSGYDHCPFLEPKEVGENQRGESVEEK